MKTLLPFALSHALVFGGAWVAGGVPDSAGLVLADGFTATLLALAWLDLTRRPRVPRPRATHARPGLPDRSSRGPAAPLRRAA
jgi:hypothetical protein